MWSLLPDDGSSGVSLPPFNSGTTESTSRYTGGTRFRTPKRSHKETPTTDRHSISAPDRNRFCFRASARRRFRVWRVAGAPAPDSGHVNARRFHAYDDFEEIELHSTILIDKRGRIYWARFGGDPFSDLDFLMKQLDRMNGLVDSERANVAALPRLLEQVGGNLLH